LLRNIPKLLANDSEHKGISGGTVEGILQLTYNKCKEYFYKYYSWNNVCISILGNFSETDKENIAQLFKKYKKNLNSIKKNDIKVNVRKKIEKYKLPYISEYENNNLYSINLKLYSPDSMTEYNFYLWLKETIKNECLKKGFMCQVELRNMIDYAYITIFFDIFDYKRSIYKVLQGLDYIFCYNGFMSSSTKYIMEKIVGKDNCLNNEKVIQFLSEAFFDKKFILNYIIAEKKIEMKRIKEILEGIEICELEVYPETMFRYEQLIQKYINSECANSYKPDPQSINWRQIRLGKKNNLQTNLALKPYYKEKHMNIEVYFFDDIECWVKLFYDITKMKNGDLLLLYIYMDIIAQLTGQKTMEILPTYNYEKK
jgi:hypothetical protein